MAPNRSIRCTALFLLAEALVAALPALGLAPRGPGAVLIGLAAVFAFVDVLAVGRREQRSSLAWLAGLLALQIAFALAAARTHGFALALAGSLPSAGWTWAAMAVVAPLLIGGWALLARFSLEPSLAAKVSVAFVGLALGAVCVATGIELGEATIAAWLSYGCVAIAALIIGPAILDGLWRLTSARQRYAALSCWLLGLVCARSIGGSAPALAPEATFDQCLAWGWAALAIAVLGSLLWRPLAQHRPATIDDRPRREPATTLAAEPRPVTTRPAP